MRNVPERDIPPETRFDVIHPLHSPDWDSFVSQRADACVFHASAWARLLADTYGFRLGYLVERQGQRIVAGLPLAETGGGLRPRRGVSLPFTDLCPLLEAPKRAMDADRTHCGAPRFSPAAPPLPPCRRGDTSHPLVKSAIEHARSRRWRSLELRECHPACDEMGSSVEYWGHTLDLTGGLPTVEARRSDSIARSTRKAAKTGLGLALGTDLDSMRQYYRLHCLTRHRHGQPPQPWNFFATLQRVVLASGLGTIVLATHHEQPVAGAVLLHLGTHAIYKFGASDETHQALRPNNLVFAEMIKHCVQIRCTTLDFGRTSLDNEGLRRFKLGWGCAERRIRYQRLEVGSMRLVHLEDRASGWHNRVFRLMPLPVAALLGRIAYRFAA